jgi:hypothetical protein
MTLSVTAMQAKIAGIILAVTLIAGLGVYTGIKLATHKTTTENVSDTSEEHYMDGSSMLRRQGAGEHVSVPSSPITIPKGGKVLRKAGVTIAPDKKADKDGKCPDVSVNFALVDDGKGGRRVIASSPDGKVVDGYDIPVIKETTYVTNKTFVGLSYSARKSVGVFIDRDLAANLRVGGSVSRSEDGKLDASLKVGVSF